MKIIFIIVCIILSARHSMAQSSGIDKNKLLDYFQNLQYKEAINYLLPVVNSDSTNLQTLSFLGYAYYMNDAYKKAAKYYEKIIGIDSNNLTANTYLENIYHNSRPEIAEILAARLIRLQPGKADNYRIMGNLLRIGNNRDSALAYYSRAYELAADDDRNGSGLADLLIDKKSYQRADSILDAGLLMDSLNIPYLKLKIRSAYEKKDFANALKPGETLIGQGEIALNPLLQLVLSYYNLKMYTDCVRVCDYMLLNDLTIESVYYYQAKALAKLHEFVKSNDLLQICLSKAISKTAEMYYYNLGQNYESLKQYQKAVAQYDTAYYLFKDPVMNYNSGTIYETALLNQALAGKYFTKYLQLAKPKSASEKQAYDYVNSRWGKGKKKPVKSK